MRISKRTLTALAIVLSLALVAALAACGGGTTDGTDTGTTGDTGNTVVARGLAFSPRTLEVSVGDTVMFTNEDAAPHDVEIDGEDLGLMGQGDSVTWAADTAGTFSYLCTIHPSMTGEIVVK